MVFPLTVTLSTGNKVSVNYQSQEVNVAVSYQLERDDTDVLAVIEAKAPEIKKAHNRVWGILREAQEQSAEDTQPHNGKASRRRAKETATTSAMVRVEESRRSETAQEAAGVEQSTAPEGTAGDKPSRQVAASSGPEPLALPSPVAPLPEPETVRHDGAGPASEPPEQAGPCDGHVRNEVNAAPPPTAKNGQPMVHEAQLRALELLLKRQNITGDALVQRLRIRYGKSALTELTEANARHLLLELQRPRSFYPQQRETEPAVAGQGVENNGK